MDCDLGIADTHNRDDFEKVAGSIGTEIQHLRVVLFTRDQSVFDCVQNVVIGLIPAGYDIANAVGWLDERC